MTFPNAYFGVKKIFTAEILNLIGTVALAVAGIASAFLMAGLVSGSGAAAIGGGIAFVIFSIGAAVLGIVGLIFMIIGLRLAGMDDENFKTGLILAIISLALKVVTGILSSLIGTTIYDDLSNAIAEILMIGVTLFVVKGISHLSAKLGEVDMEEKGRKLYILYAIIMCASVVLRFIGSIISTKSIVATGAAILAIAAGVASIVAYIIYLKYLSQAKKMLFVK